MISGKSGQKGHEHRPGKGIPQIAGSRLVFPAVVFTIGVLVGMVMLGASIYADFESTLVDVFLEGATSPRIIDCPILLSSDESGIVSTVVKNQENKPEIGLVRTHISRGHLTLMREFEQRIDLPPGEQIELEWDLTEKDAAHGNMIFAKVIFLEDDRNPIQRGSCGILVLDLPFGLKGQTVILIMYLISFVCILLASTLWWLYGRSHSTIRMETTGAMLLLGLMVLLGLGFAHLGFWLVAAGAFYLAILAIGVVVPHFLINLLRSR